MDEINYNAPIDPWDFSIEGVKCFWTPEYPFLTSDGSEDGSLIIENITKFLDDQWDFEDGMFNIPPTGPALYKNVSSPYAVLYAILYIYGDEPELISFSENAPKWSYIDPDDNGDLQDSPIVN
jgi:hypothetical protein